MNDNDVKKCREYLNAVGLAPDEVERLLSNPQYVQMHLNTINYYEDRVHSLDPGCSPLTVIRAKSRENKLFTKRKR